MDTGAGEAASLFGAADPAADPFAAALGGDSQDTTDHTNGDSSRPEQSSVASDLFNTCSDHVDLFSTAGEPAGGTPEQYGDHGAWNSGPSQATHAYDASTAAVPPTDYSQHYQGNGWYGTYQQHTATYDTTEVYGNAVYGAQTASTYDAYAPYGSRAASTAPPATNSSTQAAYDLYNPVTQPSSHAYTSSSALQPSYDPSRPAQSIYDPYKPAYPTQTPLGSHEPSAPSQAASYSARIESSYAYSLTSAGAQSKQFFNVPPAVPPAAPSAAAAAPYRPKTSNAYDPPLPPPKPPKHVPSRVSYVGSPSPSPQAAMSPPPRGKQASVHHNEGYASSVQSLHHPAPPPVQRITSPHEPMSYADHSHSAPNDSSYMTSYGSGTASQRQAASMSYVASDNRSALNGPPFPPNSTVSPPLPAATLQAAPLSPVLPSEERLASSEHGPISYAPETSVSAQMASQGQSPYEPYRATSLSHRPASPWSTTVEPVTETSNAPGPDYAVHANVGAPSRAKSPDGASVRSDTSTQRQTFEQIHHGSLSTSPPKAFRTVTVDSTRGSSANVYNAPSNQDSRRAAPPPRMLANAYDPPPIADAGRAASPSNISSRPSSVVNGAIDPYAPAATNRMRSASNGSSLSSISAVLEQPYTPSRHVRQQTSDSVRNSHERGFGGAHPPHAPTAHDSPAQVLTVPHPVQIMYAPSPSLIGANDPLGRTSVRVPVVSFGFGGKMVTCFHGTSASGGFDVALASRQSSEIKLHMLHNAIPESALDTSAASYPGPLYCDPGSPSASLVRAGAATQTKAKKGRVIEYLEERAEELSRGLGYFQTGSLQRRRAEGKQILVKLLKVMVENDGRLSGSPQIDAAVRSALAPRAVHPASDTVQMAASLSADMQSPSLMAGPSYLSLTAANQDLSDATVAAHTLRSSDLDKIQDFLLRGERRAASHYAADHKLWAHAMVIASSVDKDAWKEIVTEFIRAELASKPLAPCAQGRSSSDGREALRVAYSLFSGHGPSSIQELTTTKPLTQSVQTLQIPAPSISSVTPLSASFPEQSELMNLPPEVLARWTDTVAMIFASPLTFETSSALTALGDQLAASQWYEAAHVCYLLSPQTSPIGGIGSSSRMVLLGSPSPSASLGYAKDPDPFIFSEIAEFSLSLAPTTKGQEAFTGLPHLQPYRLIRAAALAEMGYVQLATRYCEAISNCLNRNSPYTNSTFLEQLKGLNDRLVAAPQLDKSGSWITSKVSKPSLDGIGSWVGGRLTKFIAGEDSPVSDQLVHGRQQQQPFSGPFAQYSTISSTASSAAPSPHQSTVNLTQIASSPPMPPPIRTGSATALRTSASPQINRASSAMDYTRPSLSRKSSPVPRVASAHPATTTFADASLYSQALNGHAFGSSSKQSLNGYGVQEDQSMDADSSQSNGPAMGSWWGSSDASATTPTAASFMPAKEASPSTATSGQFISLMDEFSTTPTAYQAHVSFSKNTSLDEEDDDLGLGNSSQRGKRELHASTDEHDSAPIPPKEETKEQLKPDKTQEKPAASSGGWLSRLWKRESASGPVKANLGEQTTFYYDSELKRWVNKDTGAEAAKPAVTPPPPRAQTASPSSSTRALPSGATPPPARPATTDPGEGGGPPKPPMRIRSNLVPPESNGSAPPTPMLATLPGQGPPPGGSRAKGTKRPARSRYVDVLAQQQ